MPIAYGQVFEDTFLQRIFSSQPKGFYVDVGAWHPVKYNVSFPFYIKGWRGLCIDPLEHYLHLANTLRPADTNLQCLIGEKSGEAKLMFAKGLDGLSTTIEQYGESIAYDDVTVEQRTYPVRTLSEVFAEYAVGEIDFLKIDVEGAELAVIQGNNWSIWRPKVLVIEATVPGTDIPAWDAWEPLLLEQGYLFAGFDTLNRYFVREDFEHAVALLDIDRKPWDEATYLYDLGSACDNPVHPDAVLANLLGKVLLGGLAARPELAAHLIASALDDGGQLGMSDALLDRLKKLDVSKVLTLPQFADGEPIADYLEKLLRSDALRPAIGRFSAFLAR